MRAFYLLIVLTLFSCKKPEKVAEETYELPWSTEYISYSNFAIGNHGSGFKIFYKDSLIRYDYESFGSLNISDSLLINKQILYLLKSNNGMGYSALYTKDGGVTWKEESCGPPYEFKFHAIEPNLIYCTTQIGKNIFITGLDQSNLKLYKDTLTNGIHYISDLGTDTGLDSTILNISDTVKFVVLFN